MGSFGKPGVFLAFDRKIMLGCRAVKVRARAFLPLKASTATMWDGVTAMGLELDETMLLPGITGPARFLPQASRQVFLLVDSGVDQYL